jgi:hypothetical protein
MLRTVMAILLAASLLGCVSEPGVERVDLDANTEKAVLEALTRIKATDPQKVAILNAYDSRNGRLKELEKSSRVIIGEWYKLKRTGPDYLQKVDALAEQWAQVNSDEMKARAVYERDIAVNLTAEQWNSWQDFMASAAAARRRAELYGQDGMGPSRVRY